MTAKLYTLISLLILLILTSIDARMFGRLMGRSLSQHIDTSIRNDVGEHDTLKTFRGGLTKKSDSSKQKHLTTGFMLKSFFVSLYDPSVGGLIDTGLVGHAVPAKSKEGKGSSGSFGGMFGSFSNGGSGGSFGPVCGPGGCH